MGEIYSGYNEVPSNCNMSEDEKFLFDLFRDQKINSNPISEETFLPVLKYLRQKYENIDTHEISEAMSKIGKENFWLIIKSQVLNYYIRGWDNDPIPRDWLGELSLLEPSQIKGFLGRKYSAGKDEYQRYPDIMEKIYIRLLKMGDVSTISNNIEAFGKDQWQLVRDCFKQGYLEEMRSCFESFNKNTGEKREVFTALLKIISEELKLGKYENFNYVVNQLSFFNMRIKDLLNLRDITEKINDSEIEKNIRKCQEKIKDAFHNFNEINEVVSNEDMRRCCEIIGVNKMYLYCGWWYYDYEKKCFYIKGVSYPELPDDAVKELQKTESQGKLEKHSVISSDEIYNILKNHNDAPRIPKEYNEVAEKINELLSNLKNDNSFNAKLFREILQYSDYPYLTIDDDDEIDRDCFHVKYHEFLREIFKFFYETKYKNPEELGITREDYNRFFRILANKGILINLGIIETRKIDSCPF